MSTRQAHASRLVTAPNLSELIRDSLPRSAVESTAREYVSFHAGTAEGRKQSYAQMVNDYYDLATDFYEYGWGQSFHFAPRYRGESFDASIARHELYLAAKLSLAAGKTALDLGCGVGGPMRAIARFTGGNIIGVNNNGYQIQRGRAHTRDAGLEATCSFVEADFMDLPFEEASVDAAYAIEATCHAPDKLSLFREIHRVLKPGGRFVGYEWCLTDRYDTSRSLHRELKKAIEKGNALPDIWPSEDVTHALASAGFAEVAGSDLALGSDVPWYEPLVGQWSPAGFKRTPSGRWLTNKMVRVLEWARVAPRGTTVVSEFLNAGADALVHAGAAGIFTPMFFFCGTK